MARIMEVDALRGLAIALMVVYHFFFDLDYLGIADVQLFSIEWLVFQRAIGTLFLLVVGISMALSESRNQEGYVHHAKRGLRLACIAILITVATWIYPHDGFIMFGIIHLIAAATFIAPLFMRLGRLDVLIGLAIIMAGFYVDTLQTDSHHLFWLGITYPGYRPLDHYSIIPWLGVVLIGLSIGQTLYKDGKPLLEGRRPMIDRLAFLGKHSLLIYLIHQPIILGILFIIRMLN